MNDDRLCITTNVVLDGSSEDQTTTAFAGVTNGGGIPPKVRSFLIRS